jgi:hypothetical protein
VPAYCHPAGQPPDMLGMRRAQLLRLEVRGFGLYFAAYSDLVRILAATNVELRSHLRKKRTHVAHCRVMLRVIKNYSGEHLLGVGAAIDILITH